jgi:MFS family permease
MQALFCVCVIDILGFGILIPLVPYMADRFGVTPALITPILGIYSLCQLVAAPLWGRLSDRYGRRPILISSLSGACVSYLLLGFAHNVAGLVVARALAGAMAGNISAAFAYASDISTPAQRAKSMGMVGAAIGIGFMLGPAIGGLLAGEDIRSANFLLPATVSAALSLVAIGLVYFVLRESHAPERRTQPGAAPRAGAVALLLARPALRLIAAASFLFTCSQAIFESIFAIWALRRFGFGPRTVGLVLFSLASIAVAVQGGLVRLLWASPVAVSAVAPLFHARRHSPPSRPSRASEEPSWEPTRSAQALPARSCHWSPGQSMLALGRVRRFSQVRWLQHLQRGSSGVRCVRRGGHAARHKTSLRARTNVNSQGVPPLPAGWSTARTALSRRHGDRSMVAFSYA